VEVAAAHGVSTILRSRTALASCPFQGSGCLYRAQDPDVVDPTQTNTERAPLRIAAMCLPVDLGEHPGIGRSGLRKPGKGADPGRSEGSAAPE